MGPPRGPPPPLPPQPPQGAAAGEPRPRNELRALDKFLAAQGIDDPDARREILDAGLRDPRGFPKALEVFQKEIVSLYWERLEEPVLADLNFFGARRGRGGGLETLVEKVNLIADGEAAGFKVETEVEVPGGPIRSRDGKTKERFLDVAFYRDDQMVRGFQLIKNVEDWVEPRAHDRELDLPEQIGARFPGNPPIELVWTGIQRPRVE